MNSDAGVASHLAVQRHPCVRVLCRARHMSVARKLWKHLRVLAMPGPPLAVGADTTGRRRVWSICGCLA